MPQRPMHQCSKAGCIALTRDRYCNRHQHNQQDSSRAGSNDRGYTYQWRKAAKEYLASHPWCAECGRQDTRTLATEVDHVVPHKGDVDLFWNTNNWQGMCRRCHSRKTAREDGGFGHPPSCPK